MRRLDEQLLYYFLDITGLGGTQFYGQDKRVISVNRVFAFSYIERKSIISVQSSVVILIPCMTNQVEMGDTIHGTDT
ncbi:MAG: hypothetical protein WA667_20165 [Candidatus Nitrosopolaris sp.]